MKGMFCSVLACLMLFSAIHPIRAGDDDDLKVYKLPPPQDINWSKVEGDWYEILDEKTIVDQTFPCALCKIKPTADGFSYTLVDTIKNISTEVRVIKQDSGSYRYDQNNEAKWIRFWQAEVGADKSIPTKLFKINEVAVDESVHYTDYENYLISLRCTNEGERLTRFLGPRQHPTAENILKTVNKLIELGDGWNDIPLQLSKCAVFDANPDKK